MRDLRQRHTRKTTRNTIKIAMTPIAMPKPNNNQFSAIAGVFVGGGSVVLSEEVVIIVGNFDDVGEAIDDVVREIVVVTRTAIVVLGFDGVVVETVDVVIGAADDVGREAIVVVGEIILVV